MYSQIPLFRPLLGLPKSCILSGTVLLLTMELLERNHLGLAKAAFNSGVFSISSRLNPCHDEQIKMPCPLLISSRLECLIRVFDRNSHIQ